MRRIIIFSCCSLLFFTAAAQEKKLPAEAKPFVLKGYELLDYVPGDLNGDKRPDAILILKQKKEDTASEDQPARPLLFLIRQANGKLKQEKRNDHLVMCKQCGGMMGDPYYQTIIKGKEIVFSFYGGSSWRWGCEYSFVYKPEKNNWFRVKEYETSFQEGDPETTKKESIIGEEELDEASIDRFNSEATNEDLKWKVTASKTFFYDNPKLGSKTRKGYLVKGNEVSSVRQLKNFVEVTFENDKQQFTSGYVLKKDLERIN